ncbi:ABC transporter permease [Dongia rigui]|uniref:ABC transporter permease n=1 Tax=Dongia rigui TaxID=940149 RepID=A0ABU5E163_9PROT|nr:ABC transporter permease [Dongia rigui]MDY0873208.1 ABC transporter permease [Dongia rigui]
MRAILIIARKEITDGLRNRWVLGATLLLSGLGFALAFLGSAPSGQLDVKPLAVIVVSLSSLTIFLMPLIALLISYDAIVGEIERGCMLLLLTYPVTKGQILVGKFLGHTGILAIATLVGYGAAGMAAAMSGDADIQSWKAFANLIISSILLGCAFLALAYWVSASVRERSTAAGIAIGIWFAMVVIYDLMLMGLLIGTKGWIDDKVFPYLLLANPADIYRLLNLTAFDNIRSFSGMAGLSEQAQFAPTTLLVALLAWIAVPLLLAGRRFVRSES